MKKLFLIMSMILIFCSGCATGPSVCDTIPVGDSILCDAVSGADYRLEDIGNALIIANAIAIGEEVYTREEAIDLCQDLISVLELNDGILTSELKEMFDKYPGLWDVITIYIDASVPSFGLYQVDRQIMIDWLNARIRSMTVE